MAEQFGTVIGGDLLEEIEEDLSQAVDGNGPPFAAYLGHDYTILALLAAIGQRKHPPEITGFGAFAIVQYWRHNRGVPGEENVCMKVLLYSEPFPDVNSHLSEDVIDVGEPYIVAEFALKKTKE